jgi:hypothetical protein
MELRNARVVAKKVQMNSSRIRPFYWSLINKNHSNYRKDVGLQ